MPSSRNRARRSRFTGNCAPGSHPNPALRRWKQEDQEFKANLANLRPCPKNQNRTRKMAHQVKMPVRKV